jgi:hypothetical protein
MDRPRSDDWDWPEIGVYLSERWIEEMPMASFYWAGPSLGPQQLGCITPLSDGGRPLDESETEQVLAYEDATNCEQNEVIAATPEQKNGHRTGARSLLPSTDPFVTRRLLCLLLASALQESLDLIGAVTTVTAKRPDRGQLPRLGPASHSLGIDPKESRHFGRRKESVVFLTLHVPSVHTLSESFATRTSAQACT